jgi:hypothetical protein
MRGHSQRYASCFLSWIGVGVCFAGFSLGAISQEDLSLIERPPFRIPHRASDAPQPADVPSEGSINQRFSLAGVLDAGDGMRFSVHDRQKNKPFWLAIGESVEGVTVESWDPQKSGIVMNQSGRRELVALREPQRDSGARQRAQVSSQPGGNFNPSHNFPKPPPNLPRPEKLLEQLRAQQNKEN